MKTRGGPAVWNGPYSGQHSKLQWVTSMNPNGEWPSESWPSGNVAFLGVWTFTYMPTVAIFQSKLCPRVILPSFASHTRRV